MFREELDQLHDLRDLNTMHLAKRNLHHTPSSPYSNYLPHSSSHNYPIHIRFHPYSQKYTFISPIKFKSILNLKTTIPISLPTSHILVKLQIHYTKHPPLMKHPILPYIHPHPFMITQMKPLFCLNKTISQSPSLMKFHIHPIHFFQMTLLRNILNL